MSRQNISIKETNTPAAGGQPTEDALFSSDNQKDMIRSIGIKKLTKVFLKVYKELCGPCRGMVNRNPKVDIEKYCPKCQPLVREKLQELMK